MANPVNGGTVTGATSGDTYQLHTLDYASVLYYETFDSLASVALTTLANAPSGQAYAVSGTGQGRASGAYSGALKDDAVAFNFAIGGLSTQTICDLVAYFGLVYYNTTTAYTFYVYLSSTTYININQATTGTITCTFYVNGSSAGSVSFANSANSSLTLRMKTVASGSNVQLYCGATSGAIYAQSTLPSLTAYGTAFALSSIAPQVIYDGTGQECIGFCNTSPFSIPLQLNIPLSNLVSKTHTKYLSRVPSGFPIRDTSKTRDVLGANLIDKYVLKDLLHAPTRERVLTRSILSDDSHETFDIKVPVGSEYRAVFKSKTDLGHHLRLNDVIRAILKPPMRNWFNTRSNLESHFLSTLKIRIPLGYEYRTRFISKLFLTAKVRTPLVVNAIKEVVTRVPNRIRASLAQHPRQRFLNLSRFSALTATPFRILARLFVQNRDTFKNNIPLNQREHVPLLVRIKSGLDGRDKVFIRGELLNHNEDTFKSRSMLSQHHQEHFLIRMLLATRLRSSFVGRLLLGARTCGKYITRAMLKSLTHLGAFVRVPMRTENDSRFIGSLKLQASTRETAIYRNRLASTIRSIPFVRSVINRLDWSRFVTWKSYPIAHVQYSFTTPQSLSLFRVTATLTNYNNDLVPNATVSCTVTFPDNETQQASIGNVGAGLYEATYTLHGLGVTTEEWLFQGHDGSVINTKAYRFVAR